MRPVHNPDTYTAMMTSLPQSDLAHTSWTTRSTRRATARSAVYTAAIRLQTLPTRCTANEDSIEQII